MIPRLVYSFSPEEYSEIEAAPLSVDDDDSGDYGHIVRSECHLSIYVCVRVCVCVCVCVAMCLGCPLQ